MARRETKPARREEPKRAGGKKPGGLFLGLLIGLVVGLIAAAGLAWYFNLRTGEFKVVEQAPEVLPPSQPAAEPRQEPTRAEKQTAKEAAPIPAAPTLEAPAKAVKPREPSAPIEERKQAAASQPPARVPLTFYGILPGERPAKPVEPPKPKEVWWLQVAALKNPADADKLKARLTLMGLNVATEKVENEGQSLYRVRLGPYKRDEDAFADLDTLAAHNYEPRLLKEPVKP